MPKYKLKIAYEGTAYSGWQKQKNANTVQKEINKALQVLLKAKTPTLGASRTDAGVHALGQIAHFTCPEISDLKRFFYSLNGLLPKDIRIKSVESEKDDFHARYSAKKKTYHYFLSLGVHQDPFERYFASHIYRKLDLELLQKACQCFVGTHDFSAFANESNERCARTKPVKNMTKVEFTQVRDNIYRLEFEANSFLYKMVRNIVGTLLDVANGKIKIESIPEIFASKDRKQAGFAAPARGLFLVNVHY